MNIKQAKQRFEELTGLKATKSNVYVAIWADKGYIADWYSYAAGRTNDNPKAYDCRTVVYWATLIGYLEALKEVA